MTDAEIRAAKALSLRYRIWVRALVRAGTPSRLVVDRPL